MNIKQAKEQIKNAMKAYLVRDEFDNPEISIERQRPIFLMGPPGIGKTAIMEQIAEELGVGLVAYSMTHHTRQSILGLPFIVKKNYGGKEYDVSEYTMSEIIASVYDLMEQTGLDKGILFLDEINCVSETLTPAMLQFLQYKTFGMHKVPRGWIIVTAGNPPEYNKSVREFDIVTWDRLKRIDVEADFDAWKEYAYKNGVHSSIMTYLEIKKGDFYKVETGISGKRFVTARGWDDLSEIIKVYEKQDITVDIKLVSQYIQNDKICEDFSIYYDLYNKYKTDYKVDDILNGTVELAIRNRAKIARFDERLSLLGLLIDSITNDLKDTMELHNTLVSLNAVLKEHRDNFNIIEIIAKQEKLLNSAKKGGNLSPEKEREYRRIISVISKNKTSDFDVSKQDFENQLAVLKEKVLQTKFKLKNLFEFSKDVYEQGQEMIILVTELTINTYSAAFIAKYGCDEYFENNKNLLFFERQKEIMQEIKDFDLQ